MPAKKSPPKRAERADSGKSASKQAGSKRPAPKEKEQRARSGTKTTPKRGREQTAPKPTAGKQTAPQMFDPGRLASLGDKTLARGWEVAFARADDLFVCTFLFENLKLQGKKLVRRKAGEGATVIIELPPQSFGEKAFLDATAPEVAADPPPKDKFPESWKKDPADPSAPKPNSKNVKTSNAEELGPLASTRIRMSGGSRIAFSMPAAETELAFTAAAILEACRRWPMRLNVNATPDPKFDIIRDVGIFDQAWLTTVTTSTHWVETTKAWTEALPDPRGLEGPIAAAAQRVARKAIEAFSRGERAIEEQLTQAMQAEVDTLARQHTGVRSGDAREAALGVMSLMAGQVFAQAQSKFDIARLPFLRVLFDPHKPSRFVTGIELPYRLILSPIPQAKWSHATTPVTRNGRTELWHTRLTSRTTGVGPDLPTKVRALWSPDYSLPNAELVEFVNNERPFRMSLDPLDRQMLVKLMTGFREKKSDGQPYEPRAARTQRLALSSLGGLLDVEGNWNQQPELVGIEQWRHLATLGRDHYVRVVYRGFLCPFGHSASLIKVTERKFEDLGSGRSKKGRVAVLRQRFFLVVRQRVKEYAGLGHEWKGNNFPFRSVEILTRVTPNLLPPNQSKLSDPSAKIYSAVPHRACFWPTIALGQEFLFQIAATDLCGERITFAMPLLFVGTELNQLNQLNQLNKPPKDVMSEVRTNYNKDLRRTPSFGNAVVCFAPQKTGADGDPRFPTEKATFAAGAVVPGFPTDNPQFYPEIEFATIGIAAIQRLLNRPDAVRQVTYADAYKKFGFEGDNSGEIYLKLLQPFDLDFGDKQKSDSVGALVTPSMAIQGLSRITGPVAAKPPTGSQTIENQLAGLIRNNFNPADFFKGAKILGGVDLGSILGGVISDLGKASVPKLLTKELPDRIEARFDWITGITQSDPLKLFVPLTNPQTELSVNSVVSSPVAQPAATTFRADATLKNFKVNLFGFITIWFERLRFVSESGSKPDVAVDLKPGLDANDLPNAVAFGGPLEFVNELRKIIPSNGFSDPPNLSVTPSGIAASYSLALPSVQVGIFALENVSIGCGFTLPFDARPVEVRFNFAERQRPFSLTVSLLGGGGFFALGIGTEGVREIEAALEFGARLSIDLGVASGSVEVKAGVYFHWLEKSVELGGYVRIQGELSVIGLISVSLTFNLQLSYLKEGTRSLVWGEATLIVEVDVLLFSGEVSVRCRREFAGSKSDPKFIELIPNEAVWASYCNAFAGE